MLFARGPGRPSAASLEEDDDDDLDFEDEEAANEEEGKLMHRLRMMWCAHRFECRALILHL